MLQKDTNEQYVSWGYQHSLDLKNHTRKISNIHKNFELYQVFMHNFLCETIQYSHYIYYLHTTQTTSYQTNPVLCHYQPRTCLFLTQLYYSHQPKELQSNLNYKKLLKCVHTTNFSLTNLNNKEAKKCPDAPTIFISNLNYKIISSGLQ